MKRTTITLLAGALSVGLISSTALAADAHPRGDRDSSSSNSESKKRDKDSQQSSKRGKGVNRPYTTTAGMPTPLVVSHRGASGYRPEHTLAAYELAVAQGADYIEPDLVSTKDGFLVDRHENEIGGTTNVADHAEFADRKTTKTVDGEEITGWFTEDFTLAELKTLRTRERLANRDQSAVYDGLYQIPTYREVLELREQLSKKYDRTIGIIPEIKHSTYFQSIGLPMEKKVVGETAQFGLNHRKAPMWVQSFELTNLLELKSKHGYKANTTFLTTAEGGPADLAARGDDTTYAELLAPASLKKLSKSLNGLGPNKNQVIPNNPDGTLGEPTSLVKDAHAVGLQVIPWTFRNENQYMAKDFWKGEDKDAHGKAIEEIVTYLKTGIDGFFTDYPDTGVVARELFLKGQL